jgi:hypothetical protein
MRHLIALGLPAVMLAAAHAEPAVFSDGFDPPVPVGCPAQIDPDGTPRNRLTISDVGYTVLQYTRTRVPLDDYAVTYSYNGPGAGPVLPWPSMTASSPTFKAFRMDSYIGLRFTTPELPQPGFATTLKVPTGIGSPRVTLSISRACGDFSDYLPAPGCVVVGPVPDSSVLYQWFGQQGSSACPLQPGTTYYLNAMYTDPGDRSRCTSSGQTCQLAVWR